MGRLTRIANRASRRGRSGRAAREYSRDLFGRWARRKLYGSSSSSSGKSATPGHKLGLVGNALLKQVELPTLEKPQKAKAAPEAATLSGIVDQLTSILKVVHKVGLATKQQQDSLVSAIKQANRDAKEQAQEYKGEQVNTADSLAPLESPIGLLTAELGKLIDRVRNAEVAGGDRSATSGLDIDRQRRTRGRAARTSRWSASQGLRGLGQTEVRALESKGYSVTRAGVMSPAGAGRRRFVSLRDVEGVLQNRPVGGRVTRAAGGLARGARRIGAAAGSTRVAGTLATGFRAAQSTTAGRVGARTISRIAGPLIAKGLGRTALKSIPIVGALAGAGFAIGRLLDGDPVGAGLDLVSGLGGPLTAIPAFVAAVARDTYSGVYGIQPEQDPHAGERLSQITDGVRDLVSAALRSRMTSSRSSRTQPQASVVPTPSGSTNTSALSSLTTPQIPTLSSPGTSAPPVQTQSQPAPPSQPSPSPPSVASSTTAPPQPMSAPAGPSLSSAGGLSAVPQAANDSAPPPTSIPEPVSATPIAPAANVGQQIIDRSVSNDIMAEDTSVDQPDMIAPSVPRRPSSRPTSRTGARGMGDVPPVNYPYGEFANQLYFGAAA